MTHFMAITITQHAIFWVSIIINVFLSFFLNFSKFFCLIMLSRQCLISVVLSFTILDLSFWIIRFIFIARCNRSLLIHEYVLFGLLLGMAFLNCEFADLLTLFEFFGRTFTLLVSFGALSLFVTLFFFRVYGILGTSWRFIFIEIFILLRIVVVIAQ